VLPRSRGAAGLCLDPRTAQRALPAVWLNLLCLDAPVVAITWLWLFSHTFGLPLSSGNAAALFLTAWLIYLADRLADVFALEPGAPRSLRHDFCLRHQRIWRWAVGVIAGLDAWIVWRHLEDGIFLAGACLGALALIYLLLNHSLGQVWRSVPLKEVSIGFLFAAGTLVPLLPRLAFTFVLAALLFAFLCVLNCIAIACWERGLDAGQGKVSVATRFPALCHWVRTTAFGLAVASSVAAIALPAAAPVLGCIALSAALLGLLDARRELFGNDTRTALADLVLLSPIAVLLLKL